MAIVAEGEGGRVYLEPNEQHERIARSAAPKNSPEQELANDPRAIWCTLYGLTRFRDLFTDRQLVALTTISDLVKKARAQMITDGASEDYSRAIATYLGLLVSRLTNNHCTLVLWSPSRDQSKNAFSRQGIPMTWDFAEVNPFGGAAGDLGETADSMSNALILAPQGHGQAFSWMQHR